VQILMWLFCCMMILDLTCLCRQTTVSQTTNWYPRSSRSCHNSRNTWRKLCRLLSWSRFHSSLLIVFIIIIISGFGIYGAAVVPDSGVGNTWQRLTLVLHEFLSNGLTPSRLHIVISFLTHADHVFLGLPRLTTSYLVVQLLIEL